MVSKLTGMPVQPNKAILGKMPSFMNPASIRMGLSRKGVPMEIMDASSIGLEEATPGAGQTFRPPCLPGNL